VRSQDRVRLAGALVDKSRALGLTNADVEALEEVRDPFPAESPRFE
jgi:antitoxin FitA